MVCQKLFYQGLIEDIPLHKTVSGVGVKAVEVREVACIGEEVVIEDAACKGGKAEEVADEGRADKAGASGYE